MNNLSARFICVLRLLKLIAEEQTGQALPLVLAVLVVGSLIVTPFLTHAATTLNGSRIYTEISRQKLAAGAGIEQVIWDLKFGTLSNRLTAAGGVLTYSLGTQINGFEPSITVTQSGAGGGGSGDPAGTITSPFTDRYQFDTSGFTPVIAPVSGSIYAVAYRNSGNDIILKTLEVSSDGSITHQTTGSLVLATTGYEPAIIQIAPGVIAVVYRGPSNKGYIATVQIDGNGFISATPTSPAIFVNNAAYTPSIINVNGEYFAVVYRGPADKGYVQTLHISPTGVVTNFKVSQFDFLPTCFEPSIVNTSGSFYAIACRGALNRGYLTTLNIDNSGGITQTAISSQLFTSSNAYTPNLRMTSAGIAGIVYRGNSNRGYITTLEVNDSGIITTPPISSVIFDYSAAYEPVLGSVSGTVFALFYRGSSNDGTLKTINVAVSGAIDSTPIDSYVFESTSGYEPDFLHVSANTYAAVYRGGGTPNNRPYILGVLISTESNLSYNVLSTAGAISISADFTLNAGLVRILKWEISR